MDKRDIKYLEPRKTILEQIRSGLFKVILFLIIFLTIFLFLIPGFLSLVLGHDLEKIEDNKLALENIDIGDEENAFFDLEKIQEVYRGNDTSGGRIFKYLDGEDWDDTDVAEILDINKRELRYFDNAAEKDKFLLPALAEPYEGFEKVYPLGEIRAISQVATLRALNSLRNGQDEQAFKEALNVIKVGNLIEESQIHMVGYLVGTAIRKRGLEAMQKIINETDVSIYRFQYYYDFLEDTKREINTTPLKIEYLNRKTRLKNITNGQEDMPGYEGKKAYILQNDFYFQPNQTLNIFKERYQDLISYWQKDCSVAAEKKSPTIMIDSFFEVPKLYFTRNVVGKFYANYGVVAINNVKNKYCQNQVLVNGLELMLEIKAHYLRNGELPELLADLDIIYEESGKIDVFSGLDFEYNKEEKILTSVGMDHELGTEDDIVFDLNFGQEEEEDAEKIEE